MIDPKIRTLIRVIEEGSFTRAAAALHLTQPAPPGGGADPHRRRKPDAAGAGPLLP